LGITHFLENHFVKIPQDYNFFSLENQFVQITVSIASWGDTDGVTF
jgi:hypothetical protein